MTSTPHASHLSEDVLILHFYGEADEAAVGAHLASCAHCRDEFARLQHTLALVDTADGFAPAEAPGPAFEREVWARLAPALAPRRPWWAGWLTMRALALGGGVAVLVLVAFFAGRASRDRERGEPTTTITTAAADGTVAERILVVAVVDHLDRSQMVLMEILNSDVDSTAVLAAEQGKARELISANRLYRQTAAQTGDDGTGDVLDELERALIEIANTPPDATRADLDALRARLAAGGLLFKVRVVHSEMRARERQRILPGSQS